MPAPDAIEEALLKRGRNRRSETLAALFRDKAKSANCTCGDTHKQNNPDCPRAVWKRAALDAALMIED